MDRIIVRPQESTNILSDIASPLSARAGFIGNPSPVFPVYSYRCLGVGGEGDDAKSEYYNELFLLDRRLAAEFPAAYLKLTTLPAPSYEESLIITEILERDFNRLGETDQTIFVEEIVCLLPKFSDSLLDNTIAFALRQVLHLYLKNEPEAGISVVKNFSLKLVVWLNRYLKQFDLSRYDCYPKVLFYGEIKPHEAYLLLFLAFAGCDVLYVCPDVSKDAVFKRIDKAGEFMKVLELGRSEKIEPFPRELAAVRKSTVAYIASAQIQSVIYGADVGMFKPWQLENYDTVPVTLKTTYEELKVLWKEEARMRPEFKVENGAVFIPNLFAKISGTAGNLAAYWKDFREFLAAKNILLVSLLPFTRNSYAKKELYSCAFLFNEKGLLDQNSFLNSSLYRFSHLKTSLQELIWLKMNRLMSSQVFKEDIDEMFKLKILMTIATLDNRVLELVEKFDFPGQVPKLMAYSNSSQTFSNEDLIVLAFLNSLGLDILIFTPTGYSDIEQKIREEAFDLHRLETVELGLQIPDLSEYNSKHSLLSRLIKRLD